VWHLAPEVGAGICREEVMNRPRGRDRSGQGPAISRARQARQDRVTDHIRLETI
jgi:hypothetical protein